MSFCWKGPFQIVEVELGTNRLIHLLFGIRKYARHYIFHVGNVVGNSVNKFLSLQGHNAVQLSDWCLHFISSNYIAFKNRKEFSLLTGDNKEHVEEHRWPPVAYLKEIEEYEQKYGDKKDKDGCRIM